MLVIVSSTFFAITFFALVTTLLLARFNLKCRGWIRSRLVSVLDEEFSRFPWFALGFAIAGCFTAQFYAEGILLITASVYGVMAQIRRQREERHNRSLLLEALARTDRIGSLLDTLHSQAITDETKKLHTNLSDVIR